MIDKFFIKKLKHMQNILIVNILNVQLKQVMELQIYLMQ